MGIKAVLFDLDNTLVDFVGMKKKATSAAAYSMVAAGLSEDPETLSHDLFEFYLGYWIEADDAFEKFLIEKYGAVDIRVLAAGVNAYLKEKYNNLRPYPGVGEVLGELKKTRPEACRRIRCYTSQGMDAPQRGRDRQVLRCSGYIRRHRQKEAIL